MLFWNNNKKKKRRALSCWFVMIEREIKKEPNGGRDRCPLSRAHVSLCVRVHHVSALLWSLTNLYFIHYSRLRIDWERGTYHRPSRGRERWKGHNVQLDQREGCMPKHTNVHHRFVCVCELEVGLVLNVLQRGRCPDVWFTMLCRRARGAYPFKSLMLARTNTWLRTPSTVLPLLRSGGKMSRGISFPLLPVCNQSGKPAVAQALAGSLTCQRGAVLTRRITLLRTS